MYSPRQQFVDVTKDRLNPLAMMGDHELYPRLAPPLRGAFTGGQQRDAQRFPEVVLMLVVCISAIGVNPAAARQFKREVPHSLAVVHTPRGDGKLNGDAIYGGDNLYGEPVEVLAFAGLIPPVLLSPQYPRSRYADVLTHRQREAVHGVLRCDVQPLDRVGQLEEHPHQQAAGAMHPPVEPALPQHAGHQPGAANEAHGVLEVPPKVYSGNQHSGDDLRIAHPSFGGFTMSRKFEKIVEKNVYCYCFFYHNPSGLMGSAKPKSEGFLSKANIYKALYQ